MSDNLRQSMPVATRLENGEVLRTAEDHERAAAAAAEAAAAVAAVNGNTPSETTSTPAESGTGEELIDNG